MFIKCLLGIENIKMLAQCDEHMSIFSIFSTLVKFKHLYVVLLKMPVTCVNMVAILWEVRDKILPSKNA